VVALLLHHRAPEPHESPREYLDSITLSPTGHRAQYRLIPRRSARAMTDAECPNRALLACRIVSTERRGARSADMGSLASAGRVNLEVRWASLCSARICRSVALAPGSIALRSQPRRRRGAWSGALRTTVKVAGNRTGCSCTPGFARSARLMPAVAWRRGRRPRGGIACSLWRRRPRV
jgi:hypothetical protein